MIQTQINTSGGAGAVEFMPERSYDLIDWLDRLYAPRPMKRGETVEDHLRFAGQRELIEDLIQKREEELALASEDRSAGAGV